MTMNAVFLPIFLSAAAIRLPAAAPSGHLDLLDSGERWYYGGRPKLKCVG
jgi:hypothetical protein